MKVFMTAIILVILASADAKRIRKGAAWKKVKKAELAAAEAVALAEAPLTDEDAELPAPPFAAGIRQKALEIAGNRHETAKVAVFEAVNNIVTKAKEDPGFMKAVRQDLAEAAEDVALAEAILQKATAPNDEMNDAAGAPAAAEDLGSPALAEAALLQKTTAPNDEINDAAWAPAAAEAPLTDEAVALAEAALLQKTTTPNDEINDAAGAPAAAEAPLNDEAILQKATAPNDEMNDAAEAPAAAEDAGLPAPPLPHNAAEIRQEASKRRETAKVTVFEAVNNIVTKATKNPAIMEAVRQDLVDALVAFAGGTAALAAATVGYGKEAVVPKDSNAELMCSMAKQLIEWARCRQAENEANNQSEDNEGDDASTQEEKEAYSAEKEENGCKTQPAVCSDIKSSTLTYVLTGGKGPNLEALCKTNGCEWTDGECQAKSGSVKEALENFLAEVKKAQWELNMANVKSTVQEETAGPLAFADSKWKQGSKWLQEEVEKHQGSKWLQEEVKKHHQNWKERTLPRLKAEVEKHTQKWHGRNAGTGVIA